MIRVFNLSPTNWLWFVTPMYHNSQEHTQKKISPYNFSKKKKQVAFHVNFKCSGWKCWKKIFWKTSHCFLFFLSFFSSIQWKSVGSKTTLDTTDFHWMDKIYYFVFQRSASYSFLMTWRRVNDEKAVILSVLSL